MARTPATNSGHGHTGHSHSHTGHSHTGHSHTGHSHTGHTHTHTPTLADQTDVIVLIYKLIKLHKEMLVSTVPKSSTGGVRVVAVASCGGLSTSCSIVCSPWEAWHVTPSGQKGATSPVSPTPPGASEDPAATGPDLAVLATEQHKASGRGTVTGPRLLTHRSMAWCKPWTIVEAAIPCKAHTNNLVMQGPSSNLGRSTLKHNTRTFKVSPSCINVLSKAVSSGPDAGHLLAFVHHFKLGPDLFC